MTGEDLRKTREWLGFSRERMGRELGFEAHVKRPDLLISHYENKGVPRAMRGPLAMLLARLVADEEARRCWRASNGRGRSEGSAVSLEVDPNKSE